MKTCWRSGYWLATVLLLSATAVLADDGIPPDTALARGAPECQRLLLNPMEDVTSVEASAWKLTGTYVTPAQKIEPKLGQTALTLGAAQAEQGGAKGDFTVRDNVPGNVRTIGLWVHLSEQANVDRVGVQLHDAQDETLLALVPADWTGWKWIELNVNGDGVEQAYPQADKNGTPDFPLKSLHVVWFTKAAGPTSLTVDAVAALTELAPDTGTGLAIGTSALETIQPGATLTASVFITNYTDKPAKLTVRHTLQQDAAFYAQPLPDPVYGSDHAAGSKSWLVIDEKVVDNSGSTDGKPWTASATPWQQGHFTEAYQIVDLGGVREICKMTWLSGDANHSWFVDVLASEDGDTFTPVPGLANVDHYKKWGWRDFPLEQPFRARVIKFRYRTDGKKQDIICFPCELGIYDGIADETIALPKVGPLVEEGTLSLEVPARSFSVRQLSLEKPLGTGAYLLGTSVTGAGPERLSIRHIFSALEEDPDLVSSDSRIALNASTPELAPKLRQLGIGSVRFENGKWPFVSGAPHQYSFTGKVAPWRLNMDEIYQTYQDAGLSVLTYMFLTPRWASSAPADAPENMLLSFPPKDLSWYGEFCFQMAARYGSRKHPDEELLTEDKKSGLNLVKYYEMWNEPNLFPDPKATWGGWAGSMDTFYEMMRHGAEGVKRADPDAVVTSTGYAGMTAETVDPLRTYKYPDGKCPLDFVEVLNVHFYSGQEPPETCTTDGNASITSTTTFPENLRELAEWRDQYAPGMPIWMTETGYDSAGPFGTTEAIQAARLPRVVMLCLANGIEKVFVYRETGSTASQHACSGVLRNDFSPKPSWYTFGTMIRQLHGVQRGAQRLPHAHSDVWLMEWDKNGQPLLTAWTVNGSMPLGIELGPCTMTDSFGGVSQLDSTMNVPLTPYPLYFSAISSPTELQQLHAERDRQEAAQAARLKRIEELDKYLFDFGSTEHIGRCNIEGYRTDYRPVLATDLWDAARGYGFDKPAMQDDDQAWLKGQELDRDATRVRDHLFQFRVKPGQYDLVMKVVPFKEQSQLTVTGGQEGVLKLAVNKEKPITTVRITVTADSPVLGIQLNDDYGHFTWISCVKVLE